MIFDSRDPKWVKVGSSVVFDHGTGKRIPFVIWFNSETGEYEQNIPAPNGVDVCCEPITHRPYIRRGKAVGRIELVPFAKAHQFKCEPPKRVIQVVQPMSKDERIAGLEQYKKLLKWTWQYRGESERCANDRWTEYLESEYAGFLDTFVLRKVTVPVTIHQGV